MKLLRRTPRSSRLPGQPRTGAPVVEGRWGRRVRLLRRLAIAVGLVALAAVLFVRGREFLYTSTYFRIQNVNIDGVSDKVAAKIRASLASEHGPRNLLEASPGMVSKLVLALPEVKEVTVRRRLPDTLMISAIERVPVAVLVGEQNHVIDGDLFVIGALSGPEFLESNWPLITVANPPAIIPGEAVKDPRVARALGVIRELRRKSSEIAAGLSETHVDAAGDITLVYAGGAEVRLGQRQISQVLPILEAFYKESGGFDKIEYAELQYRNQVAFKKRPDPAAAPAAPDLKTNKGR